MAQRTVAWWTIVALTLAGLALIRLGEVVVKRELTSRVRMVRAEVAGRQATYQDSLNRLNAMRVDYAYALAQTQVAPDEAYLLLKKGAQRGRVMMGDKVIYEFRFRVKGISPLEVKGEIPELPEGALSVLAREENPVWYRPDWLYERAGVAVPKDSSERKVEDAFGPYAISLGGGLAIHGPVSKDVPQDVVDHVYAELGEKDLKAVYNSVKEGSQVLIQR